MATEGNERLSGWKEIAEHLKRGPRTAQRWEKELALPVHRLKTKNGQVLFARRSELDAWMSANSASLTETTGDEADTEVQEAAPGPPETPAPERQPGRVRLHWGIIAGLGLAVVASGAFVLSRRLPVAGVTSVRVEPRRIVGITNDGIVRWTHALDRDAQPLLVNPDGTFYRDQRDQSRAANLTQDAGSEWVVPVGFAHSGAASDAVYAFSAQGERLWKVQPDDVELSFGDQTYRGPWRISSVHVSSDQFPTRTWVAFTHHTWWASFVMEISAGGDASLKYVQPGWVMSLAEWTWQGTPVLAMGGVLNEARRASLVVIDRDGPFASMPATTRTYSLRQAGAAPRVAYTFPSLEVPAALELPYGIIEELRPAGPELRAWTDLGAVVSMAADGRINSYTLSDVYLEQHRALSRAKKIMHAAEVCPEVTGVKRVRTWTLASGWRDTPFDPVSAPTKRPQ